MTDISREACNEMASRLHRLGEYEVAQLEGYSLWPFADTILALRTALDAAEARQPTVAEAAKHQGYVDGYAAAVSDVEAMRATDGVLTGQGLIVSAMKIGLTKLRAIAGGDA